MSTELTTVQPQSFPLFGDIPLRHNSFVGHYLETNGNGTLAAKLAGYPGDDRQLAVTAYRLLRNAKVKAEILRRLGKHIASGDEVLATLTRHARGDLTDVLTPDGEFDFKVARRQRLLKKLKVKTRTDKDGAVTVEKEFEIHDPQSALEKLGRFHKLFTDRVETEAADPNAIGEAVVQFLREAVEKHRAAQLALPVESSGGPSGPTSSSQSVVQVAQGGPSGESPVIDITPVEPASQE